MACDTTFIGRLALHLVEAVRRATLYTRTAVSVVSSRIVQRLSMTKHCRLSSREQRSAIVAPLKPAPTTGDRMTHHSINHRCIQK